MFRIAVRDADRDSWPRVAAYGRLVRDILIVNRGAALVQTAVYPIIDTRPVDTDTVPKHPDDATIRLVVVDGQADIAVAVPPEIAARLDRHALPRQG